MPACASPLIVCCNTSPIQLRLCHYQKQPGTKKLIWPNKMSLHLPALWWWFWSLKWWFCGKTRSKSFGRWYYIQSQCKDTRVGAKFASPAPDNVNDAARMRENLPNISTPAKYLRDAMSRKANEHQDSPNVADVRVRRTKGEFDPVKIPFILSVNAMIKRQPCYNTSFTAVLPS